MNNLNAINKKLAGRKIVDVYGDELGSDYMVVHFDNGTFLRFSHDNDGCIDSVSGVHTDLVGRTFVSIEQNLDIVPDEYRVDDENDDSGVSDVFRINTDKSSVVVVWCEPWTSDEIEVKVRHYIDSKNTESFDRMMLEVGSWYCNYESYRIYSAEAADFFRNKPDVCLGGNYLVNLGRVTPDFIREVGYDFFTLICTEKQAKEYEKAGWSIERQPSGLFGIFKFDGIAA